MSKVVNLYTPIRAIVTPAGGAVDAGTKVTVDANIPASVIYTLDGSEPRMGSFGTLRADTPFEIEIRSTTRLRYKAFDSRQGKSSNATKVLEETFNVSRTNPAESFRDTDHFYRRLVKSMVDENFYLTEGRWLLPVATRPYTYVFVNREHHAVYLRVLHNGVDVFSSFPIVGIGEAKEVPIRPTAGANTIEVQTNRGGNIALYDEGSGYDVDVYA